jgi:transcriptional regulator with XRE-family HTH domain
MTIIKLRPSAYDRRAAIMNRLSDEIFASGKSYKEIAAACGVSPSTVQAIACARTAWPRPQTLFPMITRIEIARVDQDGELCASGDIEITFYNSSGKIAACAVVKSDGTAFANAIDGEITARAKLNPADLTTGT